MNQDLLKELIQEFSYNIFWGLTVMSKQQGTVKFFNEEKGFGFITVGKGNDIFVHVLGLKNRDHILKKGESVSFELEAGQKGPQATDVVVLETLNEMAQGISTSY